MTTPEYPKRLILRTERWARRNNPNPPGTAEFYQWNKYFHLSQAEIGARVGIIESSIAAALAVTALILKLVFHV